MTAVAGAVAVVTGGGSGVGRATSLELARRGAVVAVTDIDDGRAAVVAEEIHALGGRAFAVRCDVTSTEQLQAVRRRCLDETGRVDIVMSNVGMIPVGSPEAIPMSGWERAIDLNLLSVVRALEVFLPGLLEQGSGHVVNTASMAGILPYAYDRIPYAATKAAVVSLSENLSLYTRHQGVNVTVYCPSGVRTNIREQMTYYEESRRGRTVHSVPVPAVTAETAGSQVVDAIESDTLFVVSTSETSDRLRERAADVDAYAAAEAALVPDQAR